MRALIVAAATVLMLPSVSAFEALMWGTEDLPELPDAADDVSTNAAYTGRTDFIDLTAAWFEYEDRTDVVVATVRVENAEHLEEAPVGYNVGCSFQANVTGADELRGSLAFMWVQPADRSPMRHFVRWSTPTSSANTGTVIPIPHEFASEPTEPGYFGFHVERAELLNLGDEVENPNGLCAAFLGAVDPPGYNGFFGQANAQDTAQSNSAYSFTELRQSRTAGGEPLDPIEEFERTNTTQPSSASSSLSQEHRTPAPSFAGVAVAAVVVGLLLRRK